MKIFAPTSAMQTSVERISKEPTSAKATTFVIVGALSNKRGAEA